MWESRGAVEAFQGEDSMLHHNLVCVCVCVRTFAALSPRGKVEVGCLD